MGAMDTTNMHQLNALLATFNVLVETFQPYRTGWNGSETSYADLDGGTRSAVEMSVIDVCNRISEVVKDDKRWSKRAAEQQFAQEAQLREAALKQIEEQRASMRYASSPAHLMQPKLRRMPDGMCIAFHGDMDDPEGCILGVGKTFKDALGDFNQQFNRPVDRQNAVASTRKKVSKSKGG